MHWRIDVIALVEGIFLLLRDIRRAIILDKSGFTLGTAKEFRDFIEDKTGKSLQYIK